MTELSSSEHHLSSVERLLNLLRAPSVSRPEAVHKHGCPYWREGKKHGECNCGARTMDAAIRQALIDCGVSIHESPNEVSDRIAYVRT